MPRPPSDAIPRELAGMVARYLKGKSLEEQLSFRAEVKRLMGIEEEDDD